MSDKKNFVARNEGFTCKHCQAKIKPIKHGTYRNHCPLCLHSLHVDQDIPGDRDSKCQGLMEPRGIVLSSKGYVVVHHCLECGKVSNNKTAPDDDFDKLLELSQYNAI